MPDRDLWGWPPEIQAEYDAWLKKREEEGCVCFNCIQIRTARINAALRARQPENTGGEG